MDNQEAYVPLREFLGDVQSPQYCNLVPANVHANFPMNGECPSKIHDFSRGSSLKESSCANIDASFAYSG